MCVVSMVGDHYRDLWKQQWPDGNKYSWAVPVNGPTQQEFDQLKRQVEELKLLLMRAREYDISMGQPNCDNDEKLALLREIAKKVGVDLSENNAGMGQPAGG